jgi:DNA-binding MarR family transcriptional regulator
MTRVLEKLEARKLVERVRGSHEDGRAASVRITDAGRRTRQQLDELMRQRTLHIIESIPKPKRAQILESLELLNNAIESTGCCGLNEPVSKLVEIERQK